MRAFQTVFFFKQIVAFENVLPTTRVADVAIKWERPAGKENSESKSEVGDALCSLESGPLRSSCKAFTACCNFSVSASAATSGASGGFFSLLYFRISMQICNPRSTVRNNTIIYY